MQDIQIEKLFILVQTSNDTKLRQVFMSTETEDNIEKLLLTLEEPLKINETPLDALYTETTKITSKQNTEPVSDVS
jgi:hypothetical protein